MDGGSAATSGVGQKRWPVLGHFTWPLTLGLLQLRRRYGKERLEQACAHALAIPTTRYSSIASILKQGLDQQPMLTLPEALDDLPSHTNVRGPEYYH